MQSLLDRLRQPLVAMIAGAVLFAVLGVVIIAIAEDDSAPMSGAVTTSTTTASATTAPSSSTAATPGASTTTPSTSTTPSTASTPAAGVRCELRLHGKGGGGASTTTAGAIKIVQPAGNGSGWGGRQWLYFPENRYTEARQVIADAIAREGCDRVVLNGFSNGGAFAAKLYCRGENFDGRLVGVMIDDPVTDNAVTGCHPATGVQAVLYWTGALEGDARPGWQCSKGDWTCEGGSTLGIAAYSTALGIDATPSPNRSHERNTAAPEPTRWLT